MKSSAYGPVVRFLVGPEQIEKCVHADVISGLSAPLDRLINGPMKEGREKEVIWDDIEESTFIQLFDFAYTRDYTAIQFVTPSAVTLQPAESTEAATKIQTLGGSSSLSIEKQDITTTAVIAQDVHSTEHIAPADTTLPRPAPSIGSITEPASKKRKLDDACESDPESTFAWYKPSPATFKGLEVWNGYVKGANYYLLGKLPDGSNVEECDQWVVNESGEVYDKKGTKHIIEIFAQLKNTTLLLSHKPSNSTSFKDWSQLKDLYNAEALKIKEKNLTSLLSSAINNS